MARYLVTGGCGFIGSQLTKYLINHGHNVTIVDDLSNGKIIHPDAIFIKQDITDYGAIEGLFNNIDGCFHLAAIPTVVVDIQSLSRLHEINLLGSLNVFKAAIIAGNVPVVYASTSAVYGNSTQFPLSEKQFIQPISAYGCDKLASELNAYFLANEYNLPVTGLRFFNVFGPYQQKTSLYTGVITNFIINLLEDKPLVIYGDGNQTRDFVFIDDIIANVVYAMINLKQGSKVCNICTGQRTSVNRLATILAEILNKKCIIDYQPARTYDARDSLGCQKQMHAYGFKIQHTIEDGLAKTVEYFKSL